MDSNPSGQRSTITRRSFNWDAIRSFLWNEERLFQKWSIIRQWGKWHYIWSHGICGTGVFLGLVQIMVQLYDGKLLSLPDFVITLLCNAVFGGTLFGWLDWRRLESQFHRLRAREALLNAERKINDNSTYSRHRISPSAAPK